MKLTNEMILKAKRAKSVEELLTLAKEYDVKMSTEEAGRYFEQWHKEGELSDAELDSVSGGSCGSDDTMYGTHADWGPICDGQFKNESGSAGGAVRCGNCDYFQGAPHNYGACMRDVW